MPATARSASAQPSASGPRTSQRKTGTPASRSTLSRLGTVHTRSRADSSTTNYSPVWSPGRLLACRRHPSGRRPPVRSDMVLEVGRVADLADQLLDDVLERGQAEGAALDVDHPRHVGAAALERLERVVQRLLGGDRGEGPDPLVLDGEGTALLVGLEHVLDVQVAHQLTAVREDREAAEARGRAQR